MKAIPGFDGYFADKSGSIWSKKRSRLPKRMFPSRSKGGYLRVRVRQRGKVVTRMVHRLVWLTFVGDIPPGYELDHRDRDRSNNALDNLRIATRSQQRQNRIANRGTGFKGVSWDKHNRKWQVRIGIDNIQIRIGTYDNQIDAAKAYDRAARQLHDPEFRLLNFPDQESR